MDDRNNRNNAHSIYTISVAFITGSLAGVLYGYDSIPDRWLQKLRKREELEKIADSYSKVVSSN